MDKKQRKLIEAEVEDTISSIEERLVNINALKEHLNINKPLAPPLTSEELMSLLTDDERHLEKLEQDFKNTKNYFINYLDKLKELIKQDLLYTRSCNDRFGKVQDATIDFVRYCITPLSNENRYKQVQLIDDDGLLSDVCLTYLKLKTYNICDNLNDKYGKKITEYCTNNDHNIITALIEAELTDMKKNKTGNIRHQISIQELGLLLKKIKTGEKFKIYRGFTIKDDIEVIVRKAKKDDDIEKYFQQDAGTGLSYSLDINIAFFFAFSKCFNDEEGNYVRTGYESHKVFQAEQLALVPEDYYKNIREEELSKARDTNGIKPIICEYECDPAKITGYYIQGNEAEVMIKPEDLKLLHYEIPNTKTMVERMYEWTNRDVLAPVQLKWGAFTNGLVALTITGEGRGGYIFAETERVRDSLDILMEEGQEASSSTKRLVYDTFLKNSVVIPDNIDPLTFGDGLKEYMKNPTNIKRKSNTEYTKKIKKISATARGSKAGGFG